MSGAAKELPSSSVGNYIQLFGLVLAFGVVGYSYMKKERIWPYLVAQFSGDISGDMSTSGPGSGRLSAVPEKERGIYSAEHLHPAIVSVTTSWGRWPGFFIRENALITSKQVAEPDPEKLTALQEQVDRNRQLLALEEEKMRSYRARLKNMGRGSSKKELNLLISERKKYLADFRFQQEKDEQRLAQQKKAQEHPIIKIIFADSSEQRASLVQINEEYDLALLTSSPSVSQKTVLQPPPLDALLRLGDSVFVPGGSVGVEVRLTAAIFAGYRRLGVQNRMFLQIDTEISQDKSGGPVLDAAGYVRGVVTRTVQDGKGGGFAIPIEKVLDEFAAVLAVLQEQEVRTSLSGNAGGNLTKNGLQGLKKEKEGEREGKKTLGQYIFVRPLTPLSGSARINPEQHLGRAYLYRESDRSAQEWASQRRPWRPDYSRILSF